VTHELHWTYLLAYLHLNPVRARLVMNIDHSRWTSHGAYCGLDMVPDWLSMDDLMSYFGSVSGYREYVHAVQVKRIGAEEGFAGLVFQSAPPAFHATESAARSTRPHDLGTAIAVAACAMNLSVKCRL